MLGGKLYGSQATSWIKLEDATPQNPTVPRGPFWYAVPDPTPVTPVLYTLSTTSTFVLTGYHEERLRYTGQCWYGIGVPNPPSSVGLGLRAMVRSVYPFNNTWEVSNETTSIGGTTGAVATAIAPDRTMIAITVTPYAGESAYVSKGFHWGPTGTAISTLTIPGTVANPATRCYWNGDSFIVMFLDATYVVISITGSVSAIQTGTPPGTPPNVAPVATYTHEFVTYQFPPAVPIYTNHPNVHSVYTAVGTTGGISIIAAYLKNGSVTTPIRTQLPPNMRRLWFANGWWFTMTYQGSSGYYCYKTKKDIFNESFVIGDWIRWTTLDTTENNPVLNWAPFE